MHVLDHLHSHLINEDGWGISVPDFVHVYNLRCILGEQDDGGQGKKSREI